VRKPSCLIQSVELANSLEAHSQIAMQLQVASTAGSRRSPSGPPQAEWQKSPPQTREQRVSAQSAGRFDFTPYNRIGQICFLLATAAIPV
jgi:hypothetical protein